MTNRDLVLALLQCDPNDEVSMDVGRWGTQYLCAEGKRREAMNPLRRCLLEVLDPIDVWRLDHCRLKTFAVSVFSRTSEWGPEVVISNDSQSCSLEVVRKDEPRQLQLFAGQGIVKI